MGVPDEIKQFSSYLASLTDPKERERAFDMAKMSAANAAPPEAFKPPIRTARQYLSDEIEVPPVLVEPYIVVRGGLTCTIGRAGKGKTVMNLNRIIRWSAGKPMFSGWHDKDGNALLNPARPLKTLIIENEGAGGLFHRQLGIMLHATEFLNEDEREVALDNLLVWGDGGYSGLKLDDPERLNNVRKGVEEWEPDLVFVEPFRGLWQGEENSATDMTKVVDALVEIAADYQCGVLLAHHERKSGVGEDGEKMSAGRGSTVLEGAVTVMENFEGVKGGDFRELSWSKSRHGKAPNPVRMEWVADSWWYRWVSMDDISEAIVTALRDHDGPMNVADLSEATGEKKDKLRPLLNKLYDDKRVLRMSSESSGAGSTGFRYTLPVDETQSYGGLSV